MKKIFSILTITTVMLCAGFTSQAATAEFNAANAVKFAQDTTEQDSSQMAQDSMNSAKEDSSAMAQTASTPSDNAGMGEQEEPKTETKTSFHQELKRRFIEGGPVFMGIVLICLILGLAIAIERIIFLNLSTTNPKKLEREVENALNEDGVDAAKEICRNTKGPVASIFYQGLDRTHEGIEAAEKAVVSYGGVQMGQLEKNVSWVSLFIALAPMLGFMGTVIGMIKAFDRIEAAGDMQPSLVAGGIKVALLTTVFGLIVAIILQVFYNYIIAKIDSIVNSMEDASIVLIDILVDYKHNNEHSNLK